MQKASIFLVLVSLSGCATTRLVPPSVSGNADTVAVSNTWGREEAWPYAVQHCRKHGRVPKKNRWKPFATLVFDCVQAPAL